MALSMLKNDQFASRDHNETIHHQIEALKLAFCRRIRIYYGSKEMQVTNKQL